MREESEGSAADNRPVSYIYERRIRMDSPDLTLSWLMAHEDERLELTYEYEPTLNCMRFRMRKDSNVVSRLVYVEEVMDCFLFVRIPAILESMYRELTKKEDK